MTVIAYIVIFTMCIKSFNSFIINPFLKLKYSKDPSIPKSTKRFPITMFFILSTAIFVALFIVVYRIFGKRVTKSKKSSVTTTLNIKSAGAVNDDKDLPITIDTTIKPITTTILFVLFRLVVVYGIIFIIMKYFDKNISWNAIALLCFVVIPYFILTSFTYTYAPKIMLFYTLCLLFVNFTIISIMRMGKQSYLFSMILFNLVIIIFSWWIYGTAANIDAEEPTKENEKMGRNGYLYWIAIYVTVFSLIKILLFVAGLINVRGVSALSNLFLDETRTTNMGNSVSKLVTNYYGFLNEDLIVEIMNYIYKKRD